MSFAIKMRRFTYVAAPKSKVVHLVFGKLGDGEATSCGIRMWAGWKFWTRKSYDKRSICRRCETK